MSDIVRRVVPYLGSLSSSVGTLTSLVEFLFEWLGSATILRTVIFVWDHGLEFPGVYNSSSMPSPAALAPFSDCCLQLTDRVGINTVSSMLNRLQGQPESYEKK